jgi:FMN phosphatase YigB (HAD superfamily)
VKQINKVEAFIFDLGGTLIADPFPGVKWAIADQLIRDNVILSSQQPEFNIALDKAYTQLMREDPPFASFYLGEPTLIYRAIAELGISISERFINNALEYYRNNVISFWRSSDDCLALPRPQLKALLHDLRRMGFKLGLLSNEKQEYLNNIYFPILGINHLDFDYAACSESLGFGKPDTRAFMSVLELLNIIPSHAAYIGDVIKRDIIPSKSLGMLSILTIQFSGTLPHSLTKESYPDIIIRYLGELRDILGI